MGSVLPDMMGVRARPREKEEHAADCLDMPPGFRFHPTDAEIILSYLVRKCQDSLFSPIAIAEVDLNTCEPWDLPGRAKKGEEWWFFWRRDRKYPTGTRTNRATEKGYWKATGKDKEIYKARDCLVGMKKTLVFYLGRAPKGEKTNWVMHEYRLEGKAIHSLIPPRSTSAYPKNDWVVCRVFHKNEPKKPAADEDRTISQSSSPFHTALPPLTDSSPHYDTPAHFWTPQPHLTASPFDHISPYPDSTYLGYPQFPDPSGYLLPKTGPAILRNECKAELHPLPQPSISRDSTPTVDNPGSSFDGPLADLTDYYLWSD